MMKNMMEFLSTHYILNVLASVMFLTCRSYFPLCSMLFSTSEDGECQLDWRDTEILMFLCFVLVVKNRRWKPLSNKEYLSNIFVFAKCANVLLFSRQDLRWGFFYILLCLILFLAFPEPSYSGPDNVKFFRGQALDEMLHHEPEKILLVEFYATWSPPCSRFANTFAALSMKYGTEILIFGKLDVTRYATIASKYKVDSSVTSKNLPTLILFQNGKEMVRKPFLDNKGLISPYTFKEENVIRDFNLNEIYAATKNKKKNIAEGEKKKK